jgi:ornithine cyclodeaminase/alanine dehydrogenase
MGVTLYSRADVERRLDLDEALDVVERTYAESARGRVLNPSKLTMHLGDDGGWPDADAFSIDMPAYVDWLGVAGTKWAVATWGADTQSPISSLVLLFDLDRGAFTAVMEGMYLTGVRTALQSVVGLRRLTATAPTTVGVVGAGFQARFQLLVIDHLLDIETFRLYDVDGERARSLATAVDPELDAATVVEGAPAGVADSDAVVTVTDSKTPVLDEAWLDEPSLVVALGSYRELPDATIRAADHLVVDHPDQCLQRGALADLAARGELGAEDLDATIGDVVDGEYRPSIGRDERVVFVPIGVGALDVAIAERLRRDEGGGALDEFAFV